MYLHPEFINRMFYLFCIFFDADKYVCFFPTSYKVLPSMVAKMTRKGLFFPSPHKHTEVY